MVLGGSRALPGLLLAAGMVGPAAATAAELPPSELVTIRGRLEGREVRVVSALGTWVAPHAVLSDSGIGSPDWVHYRPPRTALIETAGAPRPTPPPPLVPWSAVTELQTKRPRYGLGAITAAVTTLGIGVVYGAGFAESGATNGQIAAVAVGGGVIAGAAVTWSLRDWAPAYRTAYSGAVNAP